MSNIIKNEFHSKPVYNKKCLKTKTKSYKGKINTKEDFHCIYISVILIESVYRKDTNYCRQVFLGKYDFYVRKVLIIVSCYIGIESCCW